MNIENNYTMGINIDVNEASLDLLAKFNDQITSLSRRFTTLTKNLTAFNSQLNVTADLFERVSGFVSAFTDSTAASFAMATAEVRRFNSALGSSSSRGASHGSFSGRASHHIGREVGGAGGGLISTLMEPEIFIPAAIAYGMGKSSFTAATNMQQAEAVLRSTGWGNQFVSNAYNASMTQSIGGISPLAYMNAVAQGAAIGRTPQDALALAPAIASQNFSNKILYSANGHQFSEADERNIAQFAEFYTHSHVASKIIPGLNLAQKIYGTEAGKIPSYYLRDFSRRYALGVSNISSQGLFELVPLMQIMGGSQLGAALSAAQVQFSKGANFKTGKKATEFLQRMGIVDANGHLSPSEMKLYQQNPAEFYDTFVAEQYAKHGITSAGAIQSANALAFSGLSAKVATIAMLNIEKSRQSAIEGRKAFGLSGSHAAALQTNAGQVESLSAAWEKFSLALSRITNPILILALNNLTHILNGIADVFIVLGKAADYLFSKLMPFARRGAAIANYARGAERGSAGAFKFAAHGIASTAASEKDFVVKVFLDGKQLLNNAVSHFHRSVSAPQSTSNATQTNMVFPQISNTSYLIAGGG